MLVTLSEDDAVKETVFIPSSYTLHDFASFLFPTMVNESEEYSYMFYIDGDMKSEPLPNCLAIWLKQSL